LRVGISIGIEIEARDLDRDRKRRWELGSRIKIGSKLRIGILESRMEKQNEIEERDWDQGS
jgi:hypothetical protein